MIYLSEKNGIDKVTIRPAKAAKVIDPTGAGDAYRAGLIKGLLKYNYSSKVALKSLPLKTIGQMASLAAVYAIEFYGTQAHFYTYQNFKTRYFKEYKIKL